MVVGVSRFSQPGRLRVHLQCSSHRPYGQMGDGPWALEKANLNLVADFIAGLPSV